jgi:hypothetical protein
MLQFEDLARERAQPAAIQICIREPWCIRFGSQCLQKLTSADFLRMLVVHEIGLYSISEEKD